jgi:hypothetical protein
MTKTFVIAKGGGGINDVSAFIGNVIGRDATLVRSISASSVNDNSTFLTIEYLDKPDVSVEITNPVNGLISATVTPPRQYFVQYSQPIETGSIQSGGGQILFNNVGINTPNIVYHDDQVLELNLSGFFTGSGPWSGAYTLSLDRSILSYDGDEQPSNGLFGFNLVQQASPYIGLEELYSRKVKRGQIEIKYAVIDVFTSVDDRIKSVLSALSNGGELIAFTSTQKSNFQTEIFALVISKPEPVPDSVYPRPGSMNLDSVQLNEVTISYRNPIKTGQVATAAVYAINKSFGVTLDVDPSYVTIINDKTVVIDVEQFYLDNSIANNFITLY